VTDVERFFRRLVANLASSAPARLHHPIPLEDVYQSIIPYRFNRRALNLESSEDYEMVLLRLCAGEGDLVRTEPEDARVEFEEEVKSTNPDLDVLRRLEHVVISLRSEPLARALDPEPELELPFVTPAAAAPAPPIPGLDLPEPEVVEPIDESETPPDDDPLPDRPETLLDDPLPDDRPPADPLAHDPLPDDRAEPLLDEDQLADEPVQSAPRCLYCGDRLPADRPARFCPHCGQRQTPAECPQCHSEVEPVWRHCVNCGHALAER
jgi:Double zinc ribbon